MLHVEPDCPNTRVMLFGSSPSSWISNPSFSPSVSFTASKFASDPTIVGAVCACDGHGTASRLAPRAQATTTTRRPRENERERLTDIVLVPLLSRVHFLTVGRSDVMRPQSGICVP